MKTLKNLQEMLKNSKTLKFFKDFILVVIFYGVTIAFMLSQFIKGFTFNLVNIIACGIASYCFKVEIPEIIRKSTK